MLPIMVNADTQQTQAELFGSVFILAQYLTRHTDAALEHLGLTTRQWLLLVILSKRFPEETPTLSETAAVFGTSRQNVKQIAQQLEARGYLRLVADPKDRRALRIKTTAKVAVFDTPREAARAQAVMDRVFSGLQADELGQLLKFVRRWLAAAAPSAETDKEEDG